MKGEKDKFLKNREIGEFMLRKDYLIKQLVSKSKSFNSNKFFLTSGYETDMNLKNDNQINFKKNFFKSSEKLEKLEKLRNFISMKNLTETIQIISLKKPINSVKRLSLTASNFKNEKTPLSLSPTRSLSKINSPYSPNNLNSPIKTPSKRDYTKIKFPKLTFKSQGLNLFDLKHSGMFNSFFDTNMNKFIRKDIKDENMIQNNQYIQNENTKYTFFNNVQKNKIHESINSFNSLNSFNSTQSKVFYPTNLKTNINKNKSKSNLKINSPSIQSSKSQITHKQVTFSANSNKPKNTNNYYIKKEYNKESFTQTSSMSVLPTTQVSPRKKDSLKSKLKNEMLKIYVKSDNKTLLTKNTILRNINKKYSNKQIKESSVSVSNSSNSIIQLPWDIGNNSTEEK